MEASCGGSSHWNDSGYEVNARENACVAKAREEGEDRVGERADGGLLEQLE